MDYVYVVRFNKVINEFKTCCHIDMRITSPKFEKTKTIPITRIVKYAGGHGYYVAIFSKFVVDLGIYQ